MSIFEETSTSVDGIAMPLADGGYAVARLTSVPGSQDLIELDFFDALGTPTLTGIDVASAAAGRVVDYGYAGAYGVVGLNDGRAGVYWVEYDPVNQYDAIMFRAVTTHGTLGALRTIAIPNPIAFRDYSELDVAVLVDGDVVISADRITASDQNVVRLQFSPSVSGVAAVSVATTGNAFDNTSSITALDGGGYAVLYQTLKRVTNRDDPDEPWTRVETFVQVYAADGTAGALVDVSTSYAWGWESFDYYSPQPATIYALGNGGFAVMYTHSDLITPPANGGGYQYTVFDGGHIAIYGASGAQQSIIDVPSMYETPLGVNINGRDLGTYFSVWSAGITGLDDGSFVLMGKSTADGNEPTTVTLYDRGYNPVTAPEPLLLPAPLVAIGNAGIQLPDGRVLLYSMTPDGNMVTVIYGLRTLTLSPSSVAENVAGGTAVGMLTPIGLDPSHIVSLALGGPDAALFVLTPDHELHVAGSAHLDHEEAATRTITVTMTDDQARVTTNTFDITIGDRNEAPTGLLISRATFSTENDFVVGQALATLTAQDPDSSDIFTYTLPGNAGGVFGVSGDHLVVLDAHALNAIVNPTPFDISARVTDLGGEEFTRVIRLNFVTDGSPLANGDTFKFDEATPLDPVIIRVLSNDEAIVAAIDPATLRIVSAPSYGAAVVTASGTIRYTPGPNGFQPTTFTYRFDDVEHHESNIATVKIADRDPVPDPFVVNGITEWVDAPQGGYSEATGNFTIGRSDGWATLLRVEGGTIRAYVDRLEVTGGVVYSGIGLGAGNAELAKPLFAGPFTLNVAGARGTVTDSDSITDDLTLAGFEARMDGLQLEPTQIQLSGLLYMPGKLGGAALDLGQNTITIGPSGASFLLGVFTLPNIELKFPPALGWKSKGVALTYIGVDDAMKLQGTLEVTDTLWTHVFKNVNPVLWAKDTKGALSAKLDIGEYGNAANSNYLQVKDGELTGKGSFTVPSIRLGGGFIIKDLSATLTATDAFVLIGGGLKVGIPFGPLGGTAMDPVLFEAGIEIYLAPTFGLKSLTFGISGAEVPIPQVPGLFLNKLIGKVDGLSDATPSGTSKAALSVEGTIGLDYGPPAFLSVPDWLGVEGNGASGRPVNLDITGKIQQAAGSGALSIGGSATFFLFDPKIFKASIGSVAGKPLPTGGSLPDVPLIDFSSGAVNATGSFSVGSFFSGSGKLKGDLISGLGDVTSAPGGAANAAYLAASGSGTLKFPNIDLFGVFKDKTLANAQFFVIFSNDGNASNDSIGVSAEVPLGPGKIANSGWQLFGDGELNIFQGGPPLPAVGSWAVAPDIDWIMMTASWQIPREGAVALLVTFKERVGGPVLASYSESEFAANGIYVIEDLSGNRSRAVSVITPRAGVWDIYVVDPAGLGTITYTGIGAADPTELLWATVSRSGGAQPALHVSLDVQHAVEGALIDVYADTDRAGFDGTLVASGLSVAQAVAGVTWNLTDAPPGDLFLYAVVRDNVNGFTHSAYRDVAVRGADVADLAVSMARDVAAPDDAQAVDFTLRVVNNGPDPAASVALAIALPSIAYTVVSRSPDVGAPVLVGDVLRFIEPVLAPGAAFEVVIRTLGANGGPAVAPASASVGTLSFDPDLHDNLVLVASDAADAALPSLSITAQGPVSVVEGNSGVTHVLFSVTRTGDTSSASSVSYVVVGAQVDDTDFEADARTGTVSFLPGETGKTVSVAVPGDTAFEADESFTVKLLDPSNATIVGAIAGAVILNDDTMPGASLSIVSVSASLQEGGNGTTLFAFELTRSGDADQAVSVDYSIVGNGANPANAADFAGASLPQGTVSLAAGETSKVFGVRVAGDASRETDETFLVVFSNPHNATLATTSAQATIVNDDFNDAPTALATTRVTAEDIAIIGSLPLATDLDGDPITYAAFSQPSHGSVAVTGAGGFTYTSVANYSGPDSFVYSVTDNHGGSNIYAVGITVTPVNDAPVVANAVADQSTDIGAAFSFTPAANTFSDVDADSLTWSATLAGGLALPAWLAFNPVTHAFTGTPATAGNVSVHMTATDAGSLSASDDFIISVAAAGQSIAGTAGADSLTGTSGSDTITALAGNDNLRGLAGNDYLDGGDGLDIAMYASPRTQYAAHKLFNDDIQITGPEGTDTLHNVERAAFSDLNLGFDVDGIGGTAYRLYKAAFDRTPDAGGLGFWMYYLDRGFNLVDAANNFLNSDEFRAMYGVNPTNNEFVRLLYQHVMHRDPDAEGYKFWNDAMTNVGGAYGHEWTKGEVLTLFADSGENKALVVGVIQDGFEYALFQG